MAPYSLNMQTELAYVREQLRAVGPSKWPDVFKGSGVPIRTIRRIANEESKKAPRSDNVGKVALYFRVKEKRKK